MEVLPNNWLIFSTVMDATKQNMQDKELKRIGDIYEKNGGICLGYTFFRLVSASL